MSKTIKGIFKLVVGTLLFVLIFGSGYAQEVLPNEDNNSVASDNPFFNEEQAGGRGQKGGKNKADSTKKKVRKPLESYFFPDSIQARENFAWNVNLFTNNIKFIEIDTALYMNQVDFEFLKEDVGDAFLGNLGGATYPLSYVRRASVIDDFSFSNAYKSYFVTPSTADFYNTKKMFTLFNYLSAGQTSKREENFAITHAQNISPTTGFNLDYQSRGTRGIYTWQVARAKSLSMAVSHTGKRYSLHAGYIYNSIDAKENGGIQNDSDITDTIFELPANVPVNLEDARNKLKNNTYYVVQSYAVPFSSLTSLSSTVADKTSVYFGHSFEYSRYKRNYTDTSEESNDYYENWYINPTITSDSTFESRVSNKIFMQFQPYSRDGVLGMIDAGAGVDVHHFYQFMPSQYQTGDTDGVNYTSYYIYGAATGKIKKFLKWDADVRYHPIGYKSQDLDFGANLQLNMNIKGHAFSLAGSIRQELRSPDYWSENYYSNHFVWFNSFSKESETQFEASLTSPSLGLKLAATQNLIDNKIYYNNECLPQQYGGAISVSSFYLQKNFRIKGFNFNHRVLLQWSSAQEIIPVPLASAFLSYFYEFDIVKNVLRIQMGVDGRYNTKYYAYGYNPSTAQFYNQTETEIGNYPTLDAFVNAKWKRMRILVKYSHVNEDLFGTRNYFSVLHYPQNQRILKFVISWGFYD